jgi:hypothetical protein
MRSNLEHAKRKLFADDAGSPYSSACYVGRLLDGNRMPELQRALFLHDGQMRSPDQALEKPILHIRHCRRLVVPASSASRLV